VSKNHSLSIFFQTIFSEISRISQKTQKSSILVLFPILGIYYLSILKKETSMRKIPKKKKWPKGLPKPGTAKYVALQRRVAENKKIESQINQARKALSKV
jgi:hypothetical protein